MPNLEISRRVASLKPSVTVAFTNRAKQMRADGVDVLGFAAGEPDFDTPVVIKEAAKAAWTPGRRSTAPLSGI
jgi:aspartate aminotransferase